MNQNFERWRSKKNFKKRGKKRGSKIKAKILERSQSKQPIFIKIKNIFKPCEPLLLIYTLKYFSIYYGANS